MKKLVLEQKDPSRVTIADALPEEIRRKLAEMCQGTEPEKAEVPAGCLRPDSGYYGRGTAAFEGREGF